MNAIELNHVTKKFGSLEVVKDISLEIRQGTFLTLLGPSGCGKTTLLRMIAGLEEPSKGEISIDGKLVYSPNRGIYVDAGKRNLGLVFQSYALWPHMTAAQNVGFGLQIQKVDAAQITLRVEEALNQLGLKGLGHRYPQELSGGQQQRVALARMLVTRPHIFLMDEPLSNLDAKLRIEMRAEIKHLHSVSGATTVYVTHDQAEALTLSDLVAVMRNGVIQQLDTPRQIYHYPANLFVADFIGSPTINLLPGRLVSRNGKLCVEHGSIQVPTSAPQSLAGRDVVAAVRAEDIRVSAAPTENSIPFEVYSSLPSGPEVIVKLQKDGISLTSREAGDMELETGVTMHVHFIPEAVKLYESSTEQLIHPIL